MKIVSIVYLEYFTKGKWCYWFEGISDTFAKSRELCQKNGGDVASIKSAQELLFVTSQLHNSTPYVTFIYDIVIIFFKSPSFFHNVTDKV